MTPNSSASDAGVRMARGRAVEASGDLEAAQRIYLAILAADANHVEALHRLGQVVVETGAVPAASAAPPLNAPWYTRLAETFERRGNPDAAVAAYRQALSLAPRCTASLLGMGLLHKRRGEVDAAIACYRQAIAVDPRLAMAYNNLGTALRAKGDLVRAMACFRQALHLDPTYTKATMNLGNALQKIGRLDAAIACYRRTLTLDAGFTPAYLNLGFAFEAMGRVEEAIGAFRAVLEREPHHPRALAHLVHQYQYACDWEGVAALSRRLDELLESAIADGKTPPEPPFLNISRCMDPALNYAVARLWSRDIERRTTGR